MDNQLIKSVCKRIEGSFSFTFTALGVCSDANRMKPGEIFVPVQGQRYDGHQLIEAAIENGAIASFWKMEMPLPSTLPEGFPVFFVDDPEVAVRQMAAQYLFEVDPATVAVTGDYTRLATKKILARVLSSSYTIHESHHSRGDEISVVETILSMPRETDALLCTVSASSKASITQVSQLLQPSFVIISEFDHSSAKDSLAISIEEGMKASSTIVLDGDRPEFHREWKTDTMMYGFNENNLFKVKNIQEKDPSVTFQVEGIFMEFEIPLLLSQHVKQVTAVIGMAIHLGIGAEQIYSALKSLSLEDLALDQIGMAKDSVVLFDHDHVEESDVEYSLGMLKHLHNFKRRMIIVDEGFQANPLDKTLHETFATLLDQPITDVITIGEKAFWVTEALKRIDDDTLSSEHFVNHAQAIDTFIEAIESSSLIMYRGANRDLLEQIITELNSR
ncbi:Mur ligase family protein [Salipaludibacillus keqinensis]|uniref:Mur ligase family protein n=1 Tax=Salipaludibacillus keqinensis TaxID=2045207 RepID=UPI00130502FC|nr:Mur ligase family protein [Salipaludibacillus keqinensis]